MIKYNEIKKIIEVIKECSTIALKFYAQKNLEVSIKNDSSPVTKADFIAKLINFILILKCFIYYGYLILYNFISKL